jgi:hypothetical protein
MKVQRETGRVRALLAEQRERYALVGPEAG